MSGVNEAFKLIHFKNCHDRLFEGMLRDAADLYDTLGMLDGTMPAFTPEKELHILTQQEFVVHQVEFGLTDDTSRFLREIAEYARVTARDGEPDRCRRAIGAS